MEDKQESGFQKLEKKVGLITILIGVTVGLLGTCGIIVSSSSKKEENIKKYNQIFLEDINKKPQITKSDSIYFYQKHHQEYIIYEDLFNTTKTFEEHIKLLDIPYSKKKRIVKEDEE